MTPTEWTPEMADQARAWVMSNPDDTDASGQIRQYDRLQALTAIQRPSEHIPPTQHGLAGFRRLLPSFAGGTTEHWQDPSKEEMYSAFGGKGNLPRDVNEDQLYRDYTDARWAQEYDRAQAQGVPIVRASKHGFAEDVAPTLEKGLMGAEGLAMKSLRGSTGVGPAALRALGTGVDAAAEGLGFDARPGAEANKILIESEATIPRAVGLPVEIASGLVSGGPISYAAKGLSSALRLGKGALGRIGSGVGAGAIMGPAIGSVSDVAEGAADKLAGGEMPSVGDIASRIPERAALGAGLGLGGAAIGELAGILPKLNRSPISDLGRKITVAEDAGVTPSFTGKLSPSPEIKGTFDQLGPGENPVDIATEKAFPGVKGETAKRVSAVIRPIEETNARYYATKEGSSDKAHMGPMVRATVEMLEKRSFGQGEAPEGGSDLPVFNNRDLRKVLEQMADPVVVPDHAAHTLAETGAVKVNLDKAIHLGIAPMTLKVKIPGGAGATIPPPPGDLADVAAFEGSMEAKGEYWARIGNIGEHMAGGEPAAPARTMTLEQALQRKAIDPHSYSIAFVPRELNAQTADALIGEADRAAGISEMQGGGKSDPMWQRFVNASRQVRDQFGENEVTVGAKPVTIQGPHGEPITLKGWSALKHEHSEQLGRLRADLRRIGVPGGSPEADLGDAVTEDALRSRMQRYRSGERGSLETTRAFDRLLSDSPETAQRMREIPATQIYSDLKPMGSASASRTGLINSALGSARLRLDSPLAFISKQANPAAAAASGDMSMSEYDKLLQLAKQLQGAHP